MINNILLQFLYSEDSFVIPIDADALAYMAAVEAQGITISPARKSKHHLFWYRLKAAGIYPLLKIMYIPLWGSYAANKFNAVNPVDSDAAYRLTFPNGATYDSVGVHWNGSSQYARTYFIPSATGNYTDSTGSHMTYYSNTDSLQGDVYEIGAYDSPSKAHFMSIKNGTFTGQPYIAQYSGVLVETPIADSRGLFMINKKPVGQEQGPVMWRNETVLATSMTTVVAEPPPTCEVTLGVMNVGGTLYGYSNRGFSFSSQGYALTDTQALLFNNAVQEFLTGF